MSGKPVDTSMKGGFFPRVRMRVSSIQGLLKQRIKGKMPGVIDVVFDNGALPVKDGFL